ncbi:hypothetical protein KXX36_001321, partial [Aspergillus fumigatus]
HRTAAPDAPTIGPTRDQVECARITSTENTVRMMGPSSAENQSDRRLKPPPVM